MKRKQIRGFSFHMLYMYNNNNINIYFGVQCNIFLKEFLIYLYMAILYIYVRIHTYNVSLFKFILFVNRKWGEIVKNIHLHLRSRYFYAFLYIILFLILFFFNTIFIIWWVLISASTAAISLSHHRLHLELSRHHTHRACFVHFIWELWLWHADMTREGTSSIEEAANGASGRQ